MQILAAGIRTTIYGTIYLDLASHNIWKQNPPKNIVTKNINSNDNILVQGVIDLYFIDENENIILVDYKTDYVANGKEQDVVNKYRKQIEIYKRALEEATGNKVFKSYLCLANRDWNCYEVK